MSGADPVESAVLDALRPALDAALAHSRSTVADGDPATVPSQVRTLLKLARVTRQSLRIVRSALEADDGFRSAVAASPGAADLDGLAADWLTRAPGWDAELEVVVVRARDGALLDEEASARREAELGAQHAHDRLAGVEAELDRRRAEAGRLRERLAASSEEVDRLAADVEALAVERDSLAERAATAADRAQRAEESLGDERARRRAMASEVERLSAEVDRLSAEVEAAARAAVSPAVPSVDSPPVDMTELRRTLARAAELVGLTGAAGSDGGISRPAPPARPVPAARRPARLGRGLVDGTPEAVRALVSLDAMTVLVDGYNVTMKAWPALDIDLQRERLVAALDELCARTGGRCDVVFDGADVGPALPRPGTDRVRVWFSAAHVEADDDILARVDRLPPDRPVTVVSSDNRVRDGAARMGANVVSSDELIAVFRR